MYEAAKIVVFGLLALSLLVVGYLGAGLLWHVMHPGYGCPNSGYYQASVRADFSDTFDAVEYSIYFDGRSAARWQWSFSTNFMYPRLQFGWHRIDADGGLGENSGTLRLPSLAYESSKGTGVLTRVLLSEWLLGTTNSPPASARSVDEVFGFIEAASKGVLPAPSHHVYGVKQPVRGSIQHHRSGLGIHGLVYIWFGIWLFLVVSFGRRFRRRHDEA